MFQLGFLEQLRASGQIAEAKFEELSNSVKERSAWMFYGILILGIITLALKIASFFK